MKLSKKTISDVINFCNRDLVPDSSFNSDTKYHSEWFVEYFSFLENETVETQLGDAFYQARFLYKLMNALHLPITKQRGFIKFQIIQYASICEAVLDIALIHYFKNDVEQELAVPEYTKFPNAMSKNTKITSDGVLLTLCKTKIKKADLRRTRIDYKTKYAVSKGLISQTVKGSVDNLYDLRNNIHILRAVDSKYHPKLSEGKDAFELMQTFIGEIKQYYENHPTGS